MPRSEHSPYRCMHRSTGDRSAALSRKVSTTHDNARMHLIDCRLAFSDRKPANYRVVLEAQNCEEYFESLRRYATIWFRHEIIVVKCQLSASRRITTNRFNALSYSVNRSLSQAVSSVRTTCIFDCQQLKLFEIKFVTSTLRTIVASDRGVKYCVAFTLILLWEGIQVP